MPVISGDVLAPWNALDYDPIFFPFGGTTMANGDPHIHEITVGDYDFFWRITYGDTTILPNKPHMTFLPWRRLESESDALRRHIRACIRKHDKGSRATKARRERLRAGEMMITAAIKDLTPKRTDEWGDAQI